MIRKNGGEEHRKPCFPLNSVPSQLRKHFFEELHALSNVNFVFSLEETIKVLVSVHPLLSEQRTMYCMCKCIRTANRSSSVSLSRALSVPFSKKTTCKRSFTRFQGLSSTVPFSVGYITEFVRVNS